MAARIEFRDFSKTDWYGYAGADRQKRCKVFQKSDLTKEQRDCLCAVQLQFPDTWVHVVMDFNMGRPVTIHGQPEAVAYLRQIRNKLTASPEQLPRMKEREMACVECGTDDDSDHAPSCTWVAA